VLIGGFKIRRDIMHDGCAGSFENGKENRKK
jgi:hypothetical protein